MLSDEENYNFSNYHWKKIDEENKKQKRNLYVGSQNNDDFPIQSSKIRSSHNGVLNNNESVNPKNQDIIDMNYDSESDLEELEKLKLKVSNLFQKTISQLTPKKQIPNVVNQNQHKFTNIPNIKKKTPKNERLPTIEPILSNFNGFLKKNEKINENMNLLELKKKLNENLENMEIQIKNLFNTKTTKTESTCKGDLKKTKLKIKADNIIQNLQNRTRQLEDDYFNNKESKNKNEIEIRQEKESKLEDDYYFNNKNEIGNHVLNFQQKNERNFEDNYNFNKRSANLRKENLTDCFSDEQYVNNFKKRQFDDKIFKLIQKNNELNKSKIKNQLLLEEKLQNNYILNNNKEKQQVLTEINTNNKEKEEVMKIKNEYFVEDFNGFVSVKNISENILNEFKRRLNKIDESLLE